MAYANWLQPSKTSGSGNDTVNLSALSNNTGRNSRSTIITFKAANCNDVQRTVLQAGKPVTTSIQSTAAVGKEGGSVTITGKSNSSYLEFSLGSGILSFNLPSYYSVNGLDFSTTSREGITGDPGATAEYDFSITISNIYANSDVNEKSRQLLVTDNGSGRTAICTITQAASDPVLEVVPPQVELPWDASYSCSFYVTSNTDWTLE